MEFGSISFRLSLFHPISPKPQVSRIWVRVITNAWLWAVGLSGGTLNHMSYSLIFFNRRYIQGIIKGSIIGLIEGDSRSLDHSTYTLASISKQAMSHRIALHPKPKPQTPNPKPSTLNPKPQTRKTLKRNLWTRVRWALTMKPGHGDTCGQC